MSVFVVHTAHVHALLTAGLHYGAGGEPVMWQWPWIDAPADRGDWTSPAARDQAAQRYRRLTRESAGRVGAVLLAENRRSVDHRHDEQRWEEPYVFVPLPVPPPPVVVLKAIVCYVYQSCEHPQWSDSEAREFCDALTIRAISRLPGYDTAPWEITRYQDYHHG